MSWRSLLGVTLTSLMVSGGWMLLETRPAAAESTVSPAEGSAEGLDEVCQGQPLTTADYCDGDGLSPAEQELYDLVNAYRQEAGLPAIPLSAALTRVANRHVLDMEYNLGEATHTWSDCAYSQEDTTTWSCMWNAPQRLGTGYPGFGYENAFGGGGGYRASATDALESWKNSEAHRDVMLNQAVWAERQWNALGVGIYGGYATLWFGEEPDESEFATPPEPDSDPAAEEPATDGEHTPEPPAATDADGGNGADPGAADDPDDETQGQGTVMQPVADDDGVQGSDGAEGIIHQGWLQRGDRILLENGSFSDDYLLEAEAGQTVVISLESADFVPYLVVLTPTGERFANQVGTATAQTPQATLSLTLPTAGVYRVLANANDASGQGAYILRLR